MRKALALALIVTIVTLLAYFTKPSDKECRNKAKAAFGEKINAMVPALPATVNQTLWKETMEKAFEESVQVTDMFLYKTIYQQNNSNKKFIGWGALGFVQVDLK